tara:strand:+ start:329 stop:490 length:162 start_codon:yes stop_codon:yes gene_type:complete
MITKKKLIKELENLPDDYELRYDTHLDDDREEDRYEIFGVAEVDHKKKRIYLS